MVDSVAMNSNNKLGDMVQTRSKQPKILTREQLTVTASKLMLAVLKKEPLLSANGFETKKRENSSTDLLNPYFLDQFVESYLWLAALSWRTTFNTAHTSYGYKHILENLIGKYISNGALIAGAVALGMPYQKINHSLNVYLPLYEKDIKAARKGHDATKEGVLKTLSDWVSYRLEDDSGYEKRYPADYVRKVRHSLRPAIAVVVHKHPKECRFEVKFDLYMMSSKARRFVLFTSNGEKRIQSIIKKRPFCKVDGGSEGDFSAYIHYSTLEDAVEIANQLAQLCELDDIWKIKT